MAAAIAHRGPDDEGFLEVDTKDGGWRVLLAHRRLSIIDLAGGHQPMGNEDGRIQIVFNGEIYNYLELRDALVEQGHRFSTNSDTEVIVHAYEQYGPDCVHQLRGMFAFAIWDGGAQRLFLARDRYGQKPLFLYESDGTFLFASEIKALLAHPDVRAEVDLDAVASYLAYRYVPGPGTLLEGIRKLPPGHWALWQRGQFEERRYYTPPDCALPGAEPAGDKVVEFLSLLDDAVRLRMVADVPFGAFLSGGIDSSVVVALMSRHSGRPVKTFSVGFEAARYSELACAGQVAQQFRTEHHELLVSEQHLIEHLPELVRYRDAPVSEPSDIPIYLLAREARKSVKMVLTGEGSDEFLGGYPKHVFERFGHVYRRIPRLVRSALIEPLIQALPYRFRRAKTAIRNLGLDSWAQRMPGWFGAISPARQRALLRAPGSGAVSPPFWPHSGNSELRDMLAFDQLSWLPDNLLERGDRMTMAASLEARMPFMDHELAAWISTLPDRYRVRGLRSKWILRRAARDLLPANIVERPKVGFRVPVNEWFRGPMRDYLREHLVGPQSRTRDYYDRFELQRVLKEHFNGRQNHEKLLWTLLNLELWHRSYAPPVASG